MHPDHVAVAAIIIGAVVRLLKSDTPLPTVPARYRRALALGLGVLAGVLDAVMTGTPWLSAITDGIVAGVAAIAGHHLLIDVARGGREIPIPGITRIVPLLLIPFTGGCAGSLEAAAGPRVSSARDAEHAEHCRDLDRQHRRWGAVAKSAAVLAGGTGIATIPAEDDGARIALATGAAAGAVVAAGATWASERAAESWARECR